MGYPYPIIRQGIQLNYPFKSYYLNTITIIEPIGSVSPRINIEDKSGISLSRVQESLALFCPAQAFPVPAYR